MSTFTAYELEIIKQALNTTNPEEKNLLAKIWKIQREECRYCVDRPTHVMNH
jgi:hypothetical protein